LLLAAFGLVFLVMAVRTPVGEAQLRAWLTSLLVQATDARVSIGRVGGSLVSGVWAHDIDLRFPGGARVHAQELTASYALPVLLSGRIEVGSVRLGGVRARALATAEGWGFVAPRPSHGESATPLPTLRIRRIVIEDGRFDLALGAAPPSRVALTQLALDGSLAIDPSGVHVDLATLHAVPRGVAVSPLSARGDVTVAASGDAIRVEDVTIATQRSHLQGGGRIVFDHLVDFELAATPLSIRELRAMV